MKKIFILFLILILESPVLSIEYSYILNDTCIKFLYNLAEQYIDNPNIILVRDSYGIILSFPIKNIYDEYKNLSLETKNNLSAIQYFLAKIENPVIIEVHTGKTLLKHKRELKNWEISTVIANNAEDYMIKLGLGKDRINSVGYGEFFPAKNTPYNGGKYSNRVDIMILCNISGE